MARPFEFDREAAIEKSMFLFWRKGYCNTSAQDIADCLNLNRSSIYNSFSSKRGLFIESLKHYIHTQSASLHDFLRNSNPSPDSIRKMLEHVVEDSLKSSFQPGCFVVNTVTELGNTDEEVIALLKGNLDAGLKSFTEFIERCQKAGTVSSGKDAQSLALALFHHMTGIRVTSKIIKDKDFHLKNITGMMYLFNS